MSDNPWERLTHLIFSPMRKLGDFKSYMNKKLDIEEKLLKYPFKRDQQMTELIKYRKKEKFDLNIEYIKTHK